MTDPRSRYATVLDREIHYMEWGERGKPPLVMWHGLARTGRDFDDIARVLASDRHIIVPDTIGRGLSQWSPAPEREYCYEFYARLATALLDRLDLGTVDWLGTSMGGAIAIRAGAGPLKDRIRRLVINDIGPQVAAAAVERIRSYAGKPPRFDRVSELEAYFRQVYKPYGYLSDAQWRRLTETSARRLPDGGITTHYDPKMVLQFECHPNDNDQWPQWDALDVRDPVPARGAVRPAAAGNRRSHGPPQPALPRRDDRGVRSRAGLERAGADRDRCGVSGASVAAAGGGGGAAVKQRRSDGVGGRAKMRPTLATALLQGLKDHGAGEIFGIPGDFVLPFFKVIEESGILPHYTLSHEPAVGFAADAAARYRCALGVAVVTYGAGAFNLVNSIAGAYAERSPVVVIAGAPGARERASGFLLHHQARTVDTQAAVFREITCDQAVLDDPATAPEQIARVLRSARERSLPVYIELPRDMVRRSRRRRCRCCRGGRRIRGRLRNAPTRSWRSSRAPSRP